MSQASWPLCRGELFLRGFLQWVVSEVRPESLHLVRWFWFLHIEQIPSLAASSDLYVMGPCPSAGLKPSSWSPSPASFHPMPPAGQTSEPRFPACHHMKRITSEIQQQPRPVPHPIPRPPPPAPTIGLRAAVDRLALGRGLPRCFLRCILEIALLGN